MPSFVLRHRHQYATYWAANGFNREGRAKVDSPVELIVRLEFGRREALDPQGNTISIDATVVTDQVLKIDSAVVEGRLSNWLGTGSVGDDSEVMQVVTERSTTTLSNRATRRSYGLVKYGDSLPDLA